MKLNIKITDINILKEKKIKATLSCPEIGAVSELDIDFENLLPFSSVVSKNALDLFFLASFVYGIDRFVDRHSNSVDGWSREFNVTFPVFEVLDWKNAKSEVEILLSFLTGDYWEVNFVRNNLVLPVEEIPEKYNRHFGQVNLFSGGLDSLIGAIDFLSSNPTNKVLLVSHYDGDISARPEQDKLLKKFSLNEAYKNRFEFIPAIGVSLRSKFEKEKTFRSRSLVFLGIAVIAANYKNIPIVVPENGTVSLNFPLSPSRRSACSTRTTHPTFLENVKQLLTKLRINIPIANPYEFLTKGEMVTGCNDKYFLENVVGDSNSCGKGGHKVNWTSKDNHEDHCGVCMPCIYRQAALLNCIDPTKYGNTINKLFTGRHKQTPFLLSKQGQDFNACLDFLNRKYEDIQIRNELLVNGIRDFQKLNQYVELVKRSRLELLSWINKTGNNSIKQKAGLV